MTDLAAFVLGLVWQYGPCSAYEIRRMLADSPSTQWSGSTGAIYPLVGRLERDGLIAGSARSAGRRERRDYRVTAKGRRALRAWLGPPLAPHVATVTGDPLRSRARFLSILAPDERRAWIAAAKAALDVVDQNVRRWHERYADSAGPELRLLTRHAELESAFRRAWLTELRSLVDA